MKRSIFAVAWIAAAILGWTGRAAAQKAIGAKSGVVQFAAGEVLLNGKPLQLEKNGHAQIENGQVLSTKKGSVELVLAPAAYLWLGENASLRMRENRLSDIQLEAIQGSAMVEIVETFRAFPIQLYASKSSIEISKEGLYRLNCPPGELRVYRGDALVKNGARQIRVKKGRKVSLAGEPVPARFDARSADQLHKLVIQRSSEISVWMRRSEIETAMRQTVQVLQDEFQSMMQSQARQEEQRLENAQWMERAEQARQEMLKQQEMQKAREAGYNPEAIMAPSD